MTLPYELAKELKDAGFQSNGQAWCEELKEILPVPDLEELVEACGAGLCMFDNKNGLWVARITDEIPNPVPKVSADGPTLIIALARLWLALNRKT